MPVINKVAVLQRSVAKTPLYIEIVGSTNPRINAMSRDSQLSMLAVLEKHYTKVRITHVDTMEDLEMLVAKRPHLVVLGMKLVLLDDSVSYDESPKVWLSDYLAEHGITFTGSDTDALMLEFDKPVAKQAVIDAGLQSAAYFISPITKPATSHTLQFPLFVKPTNRGDSKGIDEMSVVHTNEALWAKIDAIHAECVSDALVEEYLPGREFSVAVMRQPRSRSLLAMPLEITSPADAHGNTFLSEAVKVADIEQVLPVTEPALKSALNSLAIGVFKALGARDYGRIDMRLDAEGIPRFIEANLMPGLSDHGYMIRCLSMGQRTSYEYMILSIVRLALERKTAPRRALAMA
jgi:D-alanine-D-alanine ligase